MAHDVAEHAKFNTQQRRVRHITSFQVRNLTPFPIRDAAASVLAQPHSRNSSTHLQGRPSDDLDATFTRKRARKISANSVNTLASHRSAEEAHGDDHLVPVPHERPKRNSISSINSINSTSPANGHLKSRRPRTMSKASKSSSAVPGLSIASPLVESASDSFDFMASMLPDHSQAELDKVIDSRLLETLLKVTVTPSTDHDPPPFPLRPQAFDHHRTPSKVLPKSPPSSSPAKPPTHARHISHDRPRRISRTESASKLSHISSDSSEQALPSSPDFISRVHRPSTNPKFEVQPVADFSRPEVLSEQSIHVELWAKKRTSLIETPSRKGKERELSSQDNEWNSLETWTISLNDLLPFSEEVRLQGSKLASNTLVIELNEQAYYLPPVTNGPSLTATTYSSDTEIDNESLRRPPPQSRKWKRYASNRTDSTTHEPSSTSSWQDLFHLVTLQNVVRDTKGSLDDIVKAADYLADDPILRYKREVSSRTATNAKLTEQLTQTKVECKRLQVLKDARSEALALRRQNLQMAQNLDRDSYRAFQDKNDTVSYTRAELARLRGRLKPIRTTLLSEVLEIYPIDLVSPPDLLFTILDVPLPIPLSTSDPAPPLSLPNHKEITADSVAASLGFAAQVVQMLAAYMGKLLVYPVTCIGSRSLIRDDISAMVGPRMFPLFSKGVDTYRYEYGVFLLNKDIEMLMLEEDLPVLDMRHTLANLKSLLLTLTNGEGADLIPSRSSSPGLSTSGLESPRPESPEDTPTTPKASAPADLPDHEDPQATTPTASETSKWNRSFLGLSFPSTFLRRQSPTPRDDDGDVDDEDDRRTLKGAPSVHEQPLQDDDTSELLEAPAAEEKVLGLPASSSLQVS